MRTSIPEARIAMHLGTRGIEKIEARFGPENQVIASHILSLNLVSSAPRAPSSHKMAGTLVRGCEASSTLGSDVLSLHPARVEPWNSLCVAASYRLTP